MKKQWVIVASALIIVGIIGLFFSKFDIFDKSNPGFEHEWEFGNMTLDHLNLQSASTDITVQFVESKDDRVYITAKGKVNRKIVDELKQATIVNGEFELDFSDINTVQFFSFGKNEDDISLKVALPKSNELKQLSAKLASGELTLLNLTADKVDLTMTSGDLKLRNSQITQLLAKSNSGEIDIEDHKGNVEISSKSGDMDINQLSGNSILQTISGGIELIQHDNSQATIKGKSGDVEVTQLKESFLDVDVNSGDIDVELASEFGGVLSLNSTSGSIKSPQFSPAKVTSEYYVVIHTTSGDINVKQK